MIAKSPKHQQIIKLKLIRPIFRQLQKALNLVDSLTFIPIQLIRAQLLLKQLSIC